MTKPIKPACRLCKGRKDLRREGFTLKAGGSVPMFICYGCRRERYLKYSKPAKSERKRAYGPRAAKIK